MVEEQRRISHLWGNLLGAVCGIRYRRVRVNRSYCRWYCGASNCGGYCLRSIVIHLGCIVARRSSTPKLQRNLIDARATPEVYPRAHINSAVVEVSSWSWSLEGPIPGREVRSRVRFPFPCGWDPIVTKRRRAFLAGARSSCSRTPATDLPQRLLSLESCSR